MVLTYAMNVMKKQVENLHSLDYQLQEENKQLDWNGLIEVKKRLVSVMNERLLDLERSAKGGNNQYAMYAEEVLVPVSPEQYKELVELFGIPFRSIVGEKLNRCMRSLRRHTQLETSASPTSPEAYSPTSKVVEIPRDCYWIKMAGMEKNHYTMYVWLLQMV